MTFDDFCDYIRNNIDAFQRDFYTKRKAAIKPEKSYPLDRTLKRWLEYMVVWMRTTEVLGRVSKPVTSEELELGEFNGETNEP